MSSCSLLGAVHAQGGSGNVGVECLGVLAGILKGTKRLPIDEDDETQEARRVSRRERKRARLSLAGTMDSQVSSQEDDDMDGTGGGAAGLARRGLAAAASGGKGKASQQRGKVVLKYTQFLFDEVKDEGVDPDSETRVSRDSEAWSHASSENTHS